jgi:hypothetical protein
MSKPQVREAGMDAHEAGLFYAGILLLTTAMHSDVLAVVGDDRERGVYIIPSPSVNADFFRLLAAANWPAMIRLAEEHLP